MKELTGMKGQYHMKNKKQYLIDIYMCIGALGIMGIPCKKELCIFYERVFKQYHTMNDGFEIDNYSGIEAFDRFRRPRFIDTQVVGFYREEFKYIPCYKEEIFEICDLAYDVFDKTLFGLADFGDYNLVSLGFNQISVGIIDPKIDKKFHCGAGFSRGFEKAIEDKQTRDQNWAWHKQDIKKAIEEYENK